MRGSRWNHTVMRLLALSFSIWNRGEHNNFPTGGSVEGRLRLVLDDQGIPRRFIVDRFEFHEPGDE